MSKKLHLLGTALLMSAGMFAQTIVGTSPENKNVILEEFTGIKCQFCPDGHARANAFKATDPDNIFLINIHAGGFAIPSTGQPDFRTPFGQLIADQSQLAGYPAGTINRHAFPGIQQSGSPSGATAQSRTTWASTGASWLEEPSYLNMGVEAEIDVAARTMTVHIEGYYTSNSPVATNMLNFAVLQNNTTGPQTGGGAGNNYNHNHRLIDMPLGQWGMEITTTSATNLVDETFVYNIPADHNGVAIDLAELEFVAFMTETTQEIITGIGGKPTYTNLPLANDVSLRTVNDIDDQYFCDSGVITPTISVRNEGGDSITSLDIEYSVNGGNTQIFTYTGSITTFQEEEITLDEIMFSVQSTNSVDISLVNDENNANNDGDTSFDNIEVNTAGNLTLEILTDDNGDEVFYDIKDINDTIVMEGGPFENNTTNLIDVVLTEGCYTFNITDTGGDGGRRVRLYDPNGVVAFLSFGQYGFGEKRSFSTDGILGIDNLNTAEVSLYPNPANTILNISNVDKSTVEVYNILGQVMMIKSNISLNEALNVSQLVTGTYFVKISNGTTTTTKKFIIAR
ncbi:T9SS type A sorting domain-containing protein [Patiriisocius marinistellae]|nr:T9SS type A sorting domain-containing protein [Patiriisocius marinistellae]